MLIVQITDLHLGFEAGNPEELNQRRLERTIDAVLALDVAPDLLLATGDLADKGAPEAYARLRAQLNRLPCPACVLPGNHDRRAAFIEGLSPPTDENGFVQYTVEDLPVRIVVLDTLEEGRHGGAYCEARAAWLEARLSEAPQRPTLIALHHPPADTGIPWMGARDGEPWTERLRAVVSRHRQVQALVAGHMHRTIATPFAGSILLVAPPTAPTLTLTLKPEDYELADDRPLVDLGPPGFAVHQWLGGRFVSHFEIVCERKVLARDSGPMHEFVRHLGEERGEV